MVFVGQHQPVRIMGFELYTSTKTKISAYKEWLTTDHGLHQFF